MLITENASRPQSLTRTQSARLLMACSVLAGALIGLLSSPLAASDHADPIDFTRKKPLEPGITDLFFFPVDGEGRVVNLYKDNDSIPLHPLLGCDTRDPGKSCHLPKRSEVSAEQRQQIKAFVVILCVRRALTQTNSLHLEPYTYKIHMDTQSPIEFDDASSGMASGSEAGTGYGQGTGPKNGRPNVEEAVARYGGKIAQPDKIHDNIVIELSLHNDASLNGDAKITGLREAGGIVYHSFADKSATWSPNEVHLRTGIRDDPFIFPPFFGTNVVAMVLSIPSHCFDGEKLNWLVWATTHQGQRQIDHVGRSLRTQNPRFELLNTLHPRDHVAAITKEFADPSLMRDVGLWLNFQQLFAYREWDFVPDVMVYTTRFPVGYPNGRYLTDDVAALLAQHGDTLLLELSHNKGQWPRHTTNDKKFSETFPYLADPHADKKPAEPYHLSMKNTLILWTIGIVIAVIVVLAIVQVVQLIRWWLGLRCRRRPL